MLDRIPKGRRGGLVFFPPPFCLARWKIRGKRKNTNICLLDGCESWFIKSFPSFQTINKISLVKPLFSPLFGGLFLEKLVFLFLSPAGLIFFPPSWVGFTILIRMGPKTLNWGFRKLGRGRKIFIYL